MRLGLGLKGGRIAADPRPEGIPDAFRATAPAWPWKRTEMDSRATDSIPEESSETRGDRIGELVKLAGRRPVTRCRSDVLHARAAAHLEWTRVVQRRHGECRSGPELPAWPRLPFGRARTMSPESCSGTLRLRQPVPRSPTSRL